MWKQTIPQIIKTKQLPKTVGGVTILDFKFYHSSIVRQTERHQHKNRPIYQRNGRGLDFFNRDQWHTLVKRQHLQKMSPVKLDQRMTLDSCHLPSMKFHSRWIKELNTRSYTLILTKNKLRKGLCWFHFKGVFYHGRKNMSTGTQGNWSYHT